MAKVDPITTLGYRNRNPFNMRKGPKPWDGESGVNQGLLTFSTHVLGLRAGYKNLSHYQTLHGWRTLDRIVPVYAPVTDGNLPESYMQLVAFHAGVRTDTVLDLTDPKTLQIIGEGFIMEEIGGLPYSTEMLEDAVAAALA